MKYNNRFSSKDEKIIIPHNFNDLKKTHKENMFKFESIRMFLPINN